MVALAGPVTAPPLIPSGLNLRRASRNGLQNDETGGNWIRGFSYLPESGAAASTLPTQCGPYDKSDIPAMPGMVTWFPVIVWTALRCSAIGAEAIDWEGRVQRSLEAGTPKALEAEFWSGAASIAGSMDNLFLAMPVRGAGEFGPIDLTPAAGAPKLKRAFGILEQALADCGLGARGMIHARPEAVPDFTGVQRNGDLLVTNNDTIVVPGNGYPNLGPGGVAAPAGETWLYATGMVETRVDDNWKMYPNPQDDGPGWLVKAMDRDTNEIVIRGERFGIASWDGQCHFACRATLDS